MTSFGVKNMYHYREIIQTNPQGVAFTFHMAREEAIFLQATLDVVGNTFDLGGRSAFADDEKIGRCIFQKPEIKFYNMFAFDVLDAVNDQIRQLFGYELAASFDFYLRTQIQILLVLRIWIKFGMKQLKLRKFKCLILL